MSESPPTPPTDLPAEIARTLADESPVVLRAAARYANNLADYRESEGAERRESDDGDHDDGRDDGQTDSQSDDRPDDVPGKASVTVKEINDNQYYYWQWRDGDQIKSKYKGPVSGDE